MKTTFSKIAIVTFAILFLSSATFALNKPIEYSSKGVTPKNYKKLLIDKIIFKWPKMEKAKSYAIVIEKDALDLTGRSDILLIFTDKNKIDINNDNLKSAIILKEDSKKSVSPANKIDIIGFFQKGHRYKWGIIGLNSKITLQPEYKSEEEIEDFFQTLETQHTIGHSKKQLYFFTEPKAFLGILSVPVSDELLELMKEAPEIIKNQLKSGEGEMIGDPSNPAQWPIIKGSPAEEAGLQAGDIILEIDDKQINKDFRVATATGLKNPGDIINVKIWRAEKIISKIFYKQIKLAKRPYKDPQY